MSQAPPRKSLRIRATWQAHIDTQILSGLSQAAYCRQRGISAGSFSAWKQKLNSVTTDYRHSERELSSVATSRKPTVIPVIVKNAPKQASASSSEVESTSDEITLKATLPNGITVELTVLPGNAFTRVLSQLGQWSC